MTTGRINQVTTIRHDVHIVSQGTHIYRTLHSRKKCNHPSTCVCFLDPHICTDHIFRNSPVDDDVISSSFPRPLAESDSPGFPGHPNTGVCLPRPRGCFSMARFCFLLDASRAQRLVRTPDRWLRHQIEPPATGTASIVASGTSTRRGSHWALSLAGGCLSAFLPRRCAPTGLPR